MLLAIDVSNTNTKLGLFEGEQLRESFRLTTDRSRTGDELAVLVTSLFAHSGIALESIDAIVIGSVVPTLRWAFNELAERYFRQTPFFVEPGIKTGVVVHFDNPSEVGADRIVNALAAFQLVGGPSIVVDFGTAITFDVISATGDYLGGVIAPGMQISAEALFARAARLPLVAVEAPSSVIGRNTVQCMQSGIFHGYVSLVDGILDRIAEELGVEPRVIATGGQVEVVAEKSKRIERVEPALTLIGLRLIHELNQGD